MSLEAPDRFPVRLLMHLNGGYTKVLLEQTIGSGMADGGITWDIPTTRIPLHLRALNSRFLLVVHSAPARAGDLDEIRHASRTGFSVEELTAPHGRTV